MSIIKTENLSHIYGKGTPLEKAALNNINLDIREGEFVGVIGHTGSGKSTLIQHFNGLLKPSFGRILIDGQDIWQDDHKKNMRALRFLVGLVFQYPEYQLFEETVFQDIAFGPSNMGLSNAEIQQRVHEAMTFVGLQERDMKKSPFDLSGGQKRRVAIAGVIAMRPKVLILDEPTAGLDPRGRARILSRISDYHASTGNTVLLISHSMEDIARYATKVLVMNEASVFDYNTVHGIFQRSRELLQIGLSVPQITRVCSALQDAGCPISLNHYTVEHAAREMLKLLSQKEAHHA